MEECLRDAEAAESVTALEVWDGALHDVLVVATHNLAVITLARVRLHADRGELKARSMTPD